MKVAIKTIIFSLLAVITMFGTRTALADQILQVFTVDIKGPEDFFELPNGTFINKLYCEGHVECGIEVDSNLTPTFFNSEKIEATADITLCDTGHSCLTARNAQLKADAIPEIVLSDGTAFAVAITEHDPLACEECSGEFKEPCCAGTLKLDFRCMDVFNVEGPVPQFVRNLSSAYVISIKE